MVIDFLLDGRYIPDRFGSAGIWKNNKISHDEILKIRTRHKHVYLNQRNLSDKSPELLLAEPV